jgi:FMN reductase
MRLVLAGAEASGAHTVTIAGPDLVLPFYDPSLVERTEAAARLVQTLRSVDGVVLVSPGYHGTLSGLVKNALDYIEDLRDEPLPYLDGRAVGCVALANGWQAAVTTLNALRSVVHALRGWPTPLGSAINTSEVTFYEDTCSDPQVEKTLRLIGEQVVGFARSGRP